MNLTFEYEKETKGTYRYREAGDEPIIGTIYVKKSALKDIGITDKQGITITIIKEEK